MSLQRTDSMVSKISELSLKSLGAGSNDREDFSKSHHEGSKCPLLFTRPAMVVVFYRKFPGLQCLHCHFQSLRRRVSSLRSRFQTGFPKVKSLVLKVFILFNTLLLLIRLDTISV